jgi:hypothetical protein
MDELMLVVADPLDLARIKLDHEESAVQVRFTVSLLAATFAMLREGTVGAVVSIITLEDGEELEIFPKESMAVME